MNISIIIVNFHSLADIKRCIDSILKKTPYNISYEIIICSNSIELDSDIESITNKSKLITFLSMVDNLGFAKANNKGANIAKGDYLFFLNPDTELINNALGILLDFANSSRKVGLIGPSLYDQSNQLSPSVRSDISVKNLISIAIPFGDKIFGENSFKPFIKKSSGIVEIIEGSAMFISEGLYREIGGMNEQFFLYSEERDLCYKVRNMGLTVFFHYDVKVRHIGGTSTSPHFLEMEKEKQISLKKYIKEHHSKLLSLYRFCYLLGYLWRSIGAILVLNKKKASQFSTILLWYIFSWNEC